MATTKWPASGRQDQKGSDLVGGRQSSYQQMKPRRRRRRRRRKRRRRKSNRIPSKERAERCFSSVFPALSQTCECHRSSCVYSHCCKFVPSLFSVSVIVLYAVMASSLFKILIWVFEVFVSVVPRVCNFRPSSPRFRREEACSVSFVWPLRTKTKWEAATAILRLPSTDFAQ